MRRIHFWFFRVGGAALVGALLVSAGCARNIQPPEGPPPPPILKFSAFDAFEMTHVALDESYAGDESNVEAAKVIDELLIECMAQELPKMTVVESVKDAVQTGTKTLTIEPLVEKIKYKRAELGFFAGHSKVLMKVTFKDKVSGEVMSAPEFYAHANAMGGSFSLGITDVYMLDRVAKNICQYVRQYRFGG